MRFGESSGNLAGMRKFLRLLILLALAVGLVWGGMALYEYMMEPVDEKRFDSHIYTMARRYDMDPDLIRAVIWRESRFDPDVYGAAKERGLMQVTPIAAEDWIRSEKIKDFELDDLYDPHTNIHAGTFYLARALGRWKDRDDPLPFALAEYNAGRTHARRWVDPASPSSRAAFMERIDYPTTKKYIEVIEKKYQEYRDHEETPRYKALWDRYSEKFKRWMGWT